MAFGTITLAWNANQEADLAGYKLHYGPAPNATDITLDVGLTATPAAPSVTLTLLQRYGTLAFTVSAYNTAGNDSAPSSTVTGAVAPKLRPHQWP